MALFLVAALLFMTMSHGDAARNSANTSLALAVHQYISSLPSSEAHHICMTGNRAQTFIESAVLLEGHTLEDVDLASNLDPGTKCSVKEYSIGSTRFLVAHRITDQCAARWKARSSTCDVLIHAHEGKSCSDLFKFRMTNDQCQAPLVVLHSDQDLLTCYGQKIDQARKQSVMPLENECTVINHAVLFKQDSQGEELWPTLKTALQQTAAFATRRYVTTAKVAASIAPHGHVGGVSLNQGEAHHDETSQRIGIESNGFQSALRDSQRQDSSSVMMKIASAIHERAQKLEPGASAEDLWSSIVEEQRYQTKQARPSSPGQHHVHDNKGKQHRMHRSEGKAASQKAD